jgi:hypothetical protein
VIDSLSLVSAVPLHKARDNRDPDFVVLSGFNNHTNFKLQMKYKLEKPVQGSIGTKKYQCTIEWRNGKFISDEPPSIGGEDTGLIRIRLCFLHSPLAN